MRRHYVMTMLYSQLGVLDEYLGAASNLRNQLSIYTHLLIVV